MKILKRDPFLTGGDFACLRSHRILCRPIVRYLLFLINKLLLFQQGVPVTKPRSDPT